MRYYLDEMLSHTVAEIAGARGLDVTSSHECGSDGLDDDEQLSFAAAEGCCLVTANRDDFETATIRFFETSRPHAGVLVVPRSLPTSDSAAIAAALVEYDRAHPEGISSYTVDFLRPPRP